MSVNNSSQTVYKDFDNKEIQKGSWFIFDLFTQRVKIFIYFFQYIVQLVSLCKKLFPLSEVWDYLPWYFFLLSLLLL